MTARVRPRNDHLLAVSEVYHECPVPGGHTIIAGVVPPKMIRQLYAERRYTNKQIASAVGCIDSYVSDVINLGLEVTTNRRLLHVVSAVVCFLQTGAPTLLNRTGIGVNRINAGWVEARRILDVQGAQFTQVDGFVVAEPTSSDPVAPAQKQIDLEGALYHLRIGVAKLLADEPPSWIDESLLGQGGLQ